MKDSDAIALLRPAVAPAPDARWADLGAGTGTFTRALAALLPSDAHVYAVDADARALRSLAAWAESARDAPRIRILHGDFTQPLPLAPLDGLVMANALHFVRDPAAAVGLAASYLRRGGQFILIEYQDRPASRWVPHPVPAARFAELAGEAGLSPPRIVARRPSAYGGEIYVAVAAAE